MNYVDWAVDIMDPERLLMKLICMTFLWPSLDYNVGEWGKYAFYGDGIGRNRKKADNFISVVELILLMTFTNKCVILALCRTL